MITDSEQFDEANKWHYIALKSIRTDDGFNLVKTIQMNLTQKEKLSMSLRVRH